MVTDISCYLSCWQQNTKNLGAEHRWHFWENLSKVSTMSNMATVTFIPGNSPAGLTAFTIIQVEFTSVHICLWTFFAYPTNPHLFLATSTHVFPSTIRFNLHTALLPKDEEHFLLTNPCFSPDPGYFLPNLPSDLLLFDPWYCFSYSLYFPESSSPSRGGGLFYSLSDKISAEMVMWS